LALTAHSDETTARSAVPLLEIKVENSQPQATVGIGLGVVAEVKNLSDASIYLYGKSFVLCLPPEMASSKSDAARFWYADFPTESPGTNANQIQNPYVAVELKPGVSYKASWSPSPDSLAEFTKDSWCHRLFASLVGSNIVCRVTSELGFLLFTPGDYKLQVVAKYWTNHANFLDATLPNHDTNHAAVLARLHPDITNGTTFVSFLNDGYYTTTQTITLRVAAPLIVVLLGAGIGGLIAHFLFPHAPGSGGGGGGGDDGGGGGGGFWRRSFKACNAVFGSMLLGVVMTLILSRISDTQLPVRVTVNDFWGAIAIGLIANYYGYSLLVKMISKADKSGGDGGSGRGKKGDTNGPVVTSPGGDADALKKGKEAEAAKITAAAIAAAELEKSIVPKPVQKSLLERFRDWLGLLIRIRNIWRALAGAAKADQKTEEATTGSGGAKIKA
jgi:hypothetical protein